MVLQRLMRVPILNTLCVKIIPQDLEDLPSTWGGYDKLPMQAKYFLNAGTP